MQRISIIQDLFDYNDWANRRIFNLCEGLTDAQLDQPREMGFGTLRNTVFHNLEAEKLWLERWLGEPWRPLQPAAAGMPVMEIAEQASDIARRRNELLAVEEESSFARKVQFQDSGQKDYCFEIGYLMNHVANHGIHHRAQALSYLRSFDVHVPAGLDYLFWKLSRPSCELPHDSLEPLRAYGLEAAVEQGHAPRFDRGRIESYFAYNDWAMALVMEAAQAASDSQLDHVFEMGMGSVRKNLQHMIDAERWWLLNWKSDRAAFPRGEEPRSLGEMVEQFASVRQQRDAFVKTLDEHTSDRVVYVTAGGPETCFRVTESLLQLCGHGTHHRAQCVNMLRQLEIPVGGIDLIIWARENVS